MENLAIHLEEGGADGFGLLHHTTDRPFEGIPIYGALDFHEQAEVPLRSRVARFLREPYV